MTPVFTAQRAAFPRAGVATDNDLIRPELWEIFALALLLFVYVFLALAFEPEDLETAGIVGSLTLTVILMTGAYRMAMRNSANMWLGLLWFRISLAVYFGLGSVVQVFFNEETMRANQVFFYALPIHFLKVNIISCLGGLTVLVTVYALCHIRRGKVLDTRPQYNDRVLLISALMFCLSGYPVKYFIVLPANLTAFNDVVVPGILGMMTQFATAGLFLLTLWCLRYDRRFIAIPLLLLALDITFGAIQFNKSEVLKPFIVVILAFLCDRLTPGRLIGAAAMVVLVYNTLIPLVDFGRIELSNRYGNIQSGTLQERFRLFEAYLDGQRPVGQHVQTALARIAYAGSSAPAVAFYDAGDPGDTLGELLIVFIPRVLWPEKPLMNNGIQYTVRVTGRDNSSTWMGLFPEGYWNFGWAGVVLFGAIYGAILYVLGVVAIDILSHSRWFHFAIVLLQFLMGVRTDGSMVLEIIVSFVICIIIYFIGNIADTLIRPILGEVTTRRDFDHIGGGVK